MNIAEFDKEFRRKIVLDGDDYSTAKAYGNSMSLFMKYYEDKYDSPLRINTRDIGDYIIYLRDNDLSPSSINQFIAAVKRFYKINGQPQKCKYLVYHDAPIKTPNILTVQECLTMCNAKVYIKHRAIINLLYYGALRRNELINLKIKDISSNCRITIINSKYGKSRMIPIPKETINLLRQYFIECKPKEYLFNGEGTRLKYSAKSIENVVKNTAILCGIKKRVHPHLLRSSRATHLIDHGAGDMYVSEFLGHAKLQTTKDYYAALTIKGMQDSFERVDKRINTLV
jgi:integrase/recombinase XerD